MTFSMNFDEFVKIRKMMRLVNQNDGVRLIVATCFDSMASLNKNQQVAAKKKHTSAIWPKASAHECQRSARTLRHTPSHRHTHTCTQLTAWTQLTHTHTSRHLTRCTILNRDHITHLYTDRTEGAPPRTNRRAKTQKGNDYAGCPSPS